MTEETIRCDDHADRRITAAEAVVVDTAITARVEHSGRSYSRMQALSSDVTTSMLISARHTLLIFIRDHTAQRP